MSSKREGPGQQLLAVAALGLHVACLLFTCTHRGAGHRDLLDQWTCVVDTVFLHTESQGLRHLKGVVG